VQIVSSPDWIKGHQFWSVFTGQLQHLQNIDSIDLYDNQLEDLHIDALVKGLANNHTVKSIWLDQNKITDVGCVNIAENLLGPESTLVFLSINTNFVDIKGANAIAKALEINTSLQELSIAENAFDFTERADSYINDFNLLEPLRKNTNSTLIYLHLGKNRIDDRYSKRIGEMFSSNSSLLRLFLSENRISDDGAEWIAQGLRKGSKSCALSSLFMDKNIIRSDGIYSILEAIVGVNDRSRIDRSSFQDDQNKELTSLDFLDNVECRGIGRVLPLLRRSKYIEQCSLSMRYNDNFNAKLSRVRSEVLEQDNLPRNASYVRFMLMRYVYSRVHSRSMFDVSLFGVILGMVR
jgi:hypothetical protein